MRKFVLLTIVSLFFVTSQSRASVLLEFDVTGLPNQSGVASNDMIWGIVVNSSGNAMSANAAMELQSLLLGFTLPTPPGVGGVSPAATQIAASDYYFIVGESPTREGGPPLFTDGYLGQITFNFATGGAVGANDAYSLIWFPAVSTSAGSSFGYHNFNAILPSDPSIVTISNITLPSTAGYTIVPEPSKVLLVLIAFCGFAFTRRR